MNDWNAQAVLYFYAHRSPAIVSFFAHLTEFGGVAVVFLVLLASLFVLWRGKMWAHALGLIAALGGSILVSEILKTALRFPRPDIALHAVVENGYSFPSNHATASMALYGFLLWCVWEKAPQLKWAASVFFAALIALIGFSRVYLGVHYPADVICGYLLGFVFIVVGVRVTRHFEKFEARSASVI
jgi:undecaprenyl-diphosphatase